MSKRFKVYGVGNALVDMEYKVESKDLLNMNIEKGVMTLINEQRCMDLEKELNAHHPKKACGGSAANTIIAVAQMGGPCFYSCRVADDSLGEFYYQDLVKEGVETNVGNQRAQGHTGQCLVFVTPDADRTMNSFLGITEGFCEQDLNYDALKDSEWIYIEGYLVASHTGREAATKAREMAQKNNVKVSLTFSDPNMVKFFGPGLKEIIGEQKIDLLFANQDEALAFAQSDDLKVAIEEFKSVAKTFCITLGAKGALVFDGEREIEVSGHQVKAVDSTGAGDMFAGAFLYGITHGYDYEKAGKLATLASANIVAAYGPRIGKEETLKIVKEFEGSFA